MRRRRTWEQAMSAAEMRDSRRARHQATATERVEIARILAEHYTPEEIAVWWSAPHPLFDGKTAEELVAAGRQTEVLSALRALDEAVYL